MCLVCDVSAESYRAIVEQIEEKIDDSMKELRGQASESLDTLHREAAIVRKALNLPELSMARKAVNEAVPRCVKTSDALGSVQHALHIFFLVFLSILLVAALSQLVGNCVMMCCVGDCQKRSKSQRFACLSWVLDLLLCVLAFLLGGSILVLTVLQTDSCVFSKIALNASSLSSLLESADVESPAVLKTLSACILPNVDRHLAGPLGLTELLDNASKIGELGGKVQSAATVEVFDPSALNDLAASISTVSWLFLLDRGKIEEDPNFSPRLDTYTEVLLSGVQLKRRELSGPIAALVKHLYTDDPDALTVQVPGLEDVERLVEPFFFHDLHPESLPPGGRVSVLRIDSNFSPDDPIVAKMAEQKFPGDDSEQRKFRNAVFWAALKQRVRSGSPKAFRCAKMGFKDGLSENRQTTSADLFRECTYEEFQTQLSDEVLPLATDSLSVFTYELEQHKATLVRKVNLAIKTLELAVEHFKANLSCEPIFKETTFFWDSWCHDARGNAALLSISCIVLGAILFVAFLMFYVMWRIHLHNNELEKKDPKQADPSPTAPTLQPTAGGEGGQAVLVVAPQQQQLLQPTVYPPPPQSSGMLVFPPRQQQPPLPSPYWQHPPSAPPQQSLQFAGRSGSALPSSVPV